MSSKVRIGCDRKSLKLKRFEGGSPHWTVSATGGSVVRLRPSGYGETSRRSAPQFSARGGGWLTSLDSTYRHS
jgi:hypothetical protein